MGDRKSEAGSRVEGAAKKADTTPIILLLQHSSAPDFWLLGSLAPLSGCPFRARRTVGKASIPINLGRVVRDQQF